MTKEPKKASVRPKRSKAETQQAFADIQEEVAAAEHREGKLVEAARLEAEVVRQAVDGLSVEKVVQEISGLGLEVSRALASVSEKLSQEVELLGSVRAAVALEREELHRLHKIDVAATALDQLVRDYARQREELDAAITARRKTWEEEAAEVARERRDQDEALKKQRQREAEDYEYRKTLERKKAQDKYDEEVRLRDRKNEERQEAFEKSWAAREAALKDQEEEIVRLRKDAAEFHARIAKEVETALAQGRKEAETRLEQQMLVLRKDAEAETRLAALQVKTLEEILARSAAQTAALEKQLADAKQQVQDIAVKAIEGASGARALSHINQIAMEQAKNRPQG